MRNFDGIEGIHINSTILVAWREFSLVLIMLYTSPFPANTLSRMNWRFFFLKMEKEVNSYAR